MIRGKAKTGKRYLAGRSMLLIFAAIALLMQPLSACERGGTGGAGDAGSMSGASRKGESGTFKAYAWHLPESGCDNIFQMFYIATDPKVSRDDNPDGAMANMAYNSVSLAARKLKEFMERKPEGARVIMPVMSTLFSDPDGDGIRDFDNWFWWEGGVESHIAVFTRIFDEYVKIGGPAIDAMVLDYEIGCDYSNIAWNYVGGRVLISNEEKEKRYQGFIDDPRYLTDLRPGLAVMGFEFYTGADHNELYNYWKSPNKPNTSVMKNIYTGVMFAQKRKCAYLNQIFDFLRKEYFPKLKSANYGSYNLLYNPDNPSAAHQWTMFEQLVPEKKRLVSPYGTHNSPYLYGKLASDDIVPEPSSYPFALFRKTPFNAAFKMLLQAQGIVLYKKGSEMMPWIGNYTWTYSDQIPYAATDYYKEFVLHLGLYDPEAILYFNADRANVDWAHDDLVLSGLLHELDEVAGFKDRESLVGGFAPSDQRYLLTGMYAGGRSVWRITPDIYTPDGGVPGGYVTPESFLADSDTLTFRIGNQVVEFPEGSYIYEAENAQSALGYWIIAPKGARPLEYRDPGFAPPVETDYTYVKGENLVKLKAKLTGADASGIAASDLMDGEAAAGD